jgi:hypothetical protein
MAEAWGEEAKRDLETSSEKLKAEAGAVGEKLKAEAGAVDEKLKAEAGAVDEKLKAEAGAVDEKLKAEANSSREKEGVPFPAGITIDKTFKEISAALARRLGKLSESACATLSIKIQKVRKEGTDFEFTVFGIRADAGVDRGHKNVHTVSITFTPRGNTDLSSENEFDTAFEQLQPLIGDTSSDYGVEEAAIDVDFSITEDAKVSILAAGDFKDESTHHLTVKLTM